MFKLCIGGGVNSAACNDSIPITASSYPRHNFGSILICLQASRKRSGAGFPFLTSSTVTIASKYLVFVFFPGEFNPADILSKHWAFDEVCSLILPILHQYGDPMATEEGTK